MTILQDREQQVFSSRMLHFVGYGLLLMAFIDQLFLVIPSQVMEPLWRFQTMGAIVERVPIIFLGLVLVYYGETSDRIAGEKLVLKLLSWCSLLAAILMMLTIPLSIGTGVLLDQQQNATVDVQFVSQQDALEQFQAQLKTAKSKDEIQAILQQQGNQGVNIPDSVDTKQLKQSIIASLQNNQENLTNQAQAFRREKRSLLIKQCLKWNLGALIASILLFLIWKSTAWSRRKPSATELD
ncbi:MAG: HpsJ family protein [Cyanobacteria bacterium J06621_8]